MSQLNHLVKLHTLLPPICKNLRRTQNRACFDLIYCAGDNRALDQIAYEAGWLLGIQSGRKSVPGYPVAFVDVEYRRPDFEKRLRVVGKHRPKYATVPDLSDTEVSEADIEHMLLQYQQLSNYCQVPLIVPKLPEQFPFIPPSVALGWSVRTSYGGVSERMKPWHFEEHRVHILGGNPHEQMDLYTQLVLGTEVMSADGNLAMKLATQFAKFWQHGAWVPHPERHANTPDLYLECWRRSCANIRGAWERLVPLSQKDQKEEKNDALSCLSR